LIDGGYFDNDLGLPDDVSKEAQAVYENIPNEPSKPSYFTLDELYRLVTNYYVNKIGDIKDRVDKESELLLNAKIDWIINKMENPDTKPVNFNKLNYKTFWQRTIEEQVGELMGIQNIYTRLRTTVETVYLDYIKNKDIRVIWFIY
jgi:hypothetical protein